MCRLREREKEYKIREHELGKNLESYACRAETEALAEAESCGLMRRSGWVGNSSAQAQMDGSRCL